jgi:hypothetical protein
MASTNFLYDNARELFATGQINWLTDTIRACLVTNSYSPSQANDDFMSSIASANILGSGTGGQRITLVNKTATGGACDADDITFTSIGGGANPPSVEALVIYKFITDDTDSPLIAYLGGATGLPLLTNSGDIICQFDSGANRIFRL